ncbi:alpha/beta hydrolase fold domain-containing protein [Gordonia araii NBRC 100433]|nr:alpha/beta fold hydrolase [Gordonia araii]NNG96166.1 alpha/beta hydrolase fold domain-containing protein [Gordonia araii NBRC 100433]
MKRHKVAYGDHESQFGHLYEPAVGPERGDGPVPLVVLIHGGFFSTRFALTIETAIARLMSERGAAVWNVEYRRVEEDGGGWPGTGADAVAALRALDGKVPAVLPAELLDSIAFDDVAVVGHSAGGLLAVWGTAQLGARTARTRITRVVAQSAVLDLTHPRARDRPTPRNLMGAPYEEIPDRYAQASPILAPVFDAHVIAMHAGGDAAVPVESSRRYVEAVSARGQSAELVVVADEGHDAFVDPRSACTRQTLRLLGL